MRETGFTQPSRCFPRLHDCPVETESPEQAGASWVCHKDWGAWLASISLRCQTLLDAKAGGWCWGGGVGMGSKRLRGVFAASLTFFELELSMGAGISPRSRNPVV